MSDNLFHNQYRIPSARATWHDYNSGAYFVTICTRGRDHFFGEISLTPVETGRAPSLRERMKQTDNCKGWLSIVVGGIKSSITKFANANYLPFAWQTRFHDRIIRDRDEMNRIAQYIENNVAQWESDIFYD